MIRLNNVQVPFHVMECESNELGFSLFSVDIPGLFDRNGIYADANSGMPYSDEVERYIAFQQAVLKFIQHIGGIDIIHCHDHHTGLIPFMVKHCPEYRSLASIPTVFTIHNGQYHGSFSWDKAYLLPWYDAQARGLLDWDNRINPMATAITQRQKKVVLNSRLSYPRNVRHELFDVSHGEISRDKRSED